MASPRDPWLWPFTPQSPWNTPIGAGAVFSANKAAITSDIVAGGTDIHAGVWSHPLYLAVTTDPVVDVFDVENNRHIKALVPVGATPDPMADAHMYVVEPSRHFVLEMYGAARVAVGSIKAVRTDTVDLYGTGIHITDALFPGVRAMDASGMGGLIRTWELRAGSINHVITFLLPLSRLQHGPVWPSLREDYWGFRDYHGHVPIGTLIAIPPSVNLSAMHLTPGGMNLARTLQDYGAYCDDAGGTSRLVLAAEGAAEGLPELDQMRSDLNILHPYLRAVLNNTATTPGGGGAPRRPAAPPLGVAPAKAPSPIATTAKAPAAH